MSDERDERLREEWQEHPEIAALGAAGDIFATRAGRGPESPEERAAREGPPAVDGPSLDELIEREPGPVVTDFTSGARAEHEAAEDEPAAQPSSSEEPSSSASP